jgi:hypothetical protein
VIEILSFLTWSALLAYWSYSIGYARCLTRGGDDAHDGRNVHVG